MINFGSGSTLTMSHSRGGTIRWEDHPICGGDCPVGYRTVHSFFFSLGMNIKEFSVSSY